MGPVILEDLGTDWDIVTDMALKLVPGGHLSCAWRGGRQCSAREQTWPLEQVAKSLFLGPA